MFFFITGAKSSYARKDDVSAEAATEFFVCPCHRSGYNGVFHLPYNVAAKEWTKMYSKQNYFLHRMKMKILSIILFDNMTWTHFLTILNTPYIPHLSLLKEVRK